MPQTPVLQQPSLELGEEGVILIADPSRVNETVPNLVQLLDPIQPLLPRPRKLFIAGLGVSLLEEFLPKFVTMRKHSLIVDQVHAVPRLYVVVRRTVEILREHSLARALANRPGYSITPPVAPILVLQT